MSPPARRTIHINEPVVSGQSVRFSWTVEPRDDFYRREEFTITYPSSIDPAPVPGAIWLRVMMISMYTHWAIMQPVRVVLPRKLGAGEREFWLRMIDAAEWALAIDTKSDVPFSTRTLRRAEIVETGTPLEPITTLDAPGGSVSCFSGGRDSLAQLGLLQELGEDPLLVTVTSRREGSLEFETTRRAEVIATAVERRGTDHIDVDSDFRSCMDNFNADARRLGVSVTEICDTLHYFAVAWAAGYSRGARAVYQASEADLQTSIRHQGAVVSFKHFMYTAATQRSLSALIAPSGIEFCGLTYPVLQFQVQRLLDLRYPDLRDLQYSCWSQQDGEDVCSRCRECLANAVDRMTDGLPPSEMGIDLDQLIAASGDWQPGGRPEAPRGAVSAIAGTARDDHMLRFFRTHDVEDIAHLAGPAGLGPDARQAYARIRATVDASPEPPAEPGLRAELLDFVDPQVRERLSTIYAEHFEDEPVENYEHDVRNAKLLIDWTTAPLAADGNKPPAPPREFTLAQTPPRAELSDAQVAEIGHLIPAPEPNVVRDGEQRYLPVADPDLAGDELTLVTEAVSSGWISSAGPYIEEFERRFAEYCGVRHAITTSSGATALEVLLRAAGIGPGHEVIIPTFTMVATANAVHHTGAKVVMVDTDPETWNMDLAAVRRLIGPRTRAIIAMHTYGHPVDMDALRELADANSLLLFEDAAEAHGATCRGRRAGGLGDAAAFSLYGNKIITSGEGGVITTDDDSIAAAARDLRSHAFSEDRHFWHRRRAFNFRMSNLQAAIGLAQLDRLDEFLERRRTLAQMYRDQLEPIPGITMQPAQEGMQSANWMFGVLLADDFPCTRDELRETLAAAGVETRTFFIPLHVQPAYIDEFAGRRHPVAEKFGRDGLYLPSALWLTDEDVARVASVIADSAAARAIPGR
ncbi:MAG: DegT/DnrJ/EryC1/StrS family aminotransferase [Thermoleophilaceae bacterium]|nr:DegT/DnrJ/EryC1/StrS family aminotransferase [Thermoleophilaceae bacterium]